MIDSRSVLNLPKTIKIILALIIIVILFGSISLTLFIVSNYEEANDWLLISLAITQSSMTLFFLGTILLFGELGFKESSVEKKTDLFLESTLPKQLKKIKHTKNDTTSIQVLSDIDIFGRGYRLSIDSKDYLLWFGLNVKRLFSIYFVVVDTENNHFKTNTNYNSSATDYVKWLQEDVFKFTFGGAIKVGYSVNFELVKVDSVDLVSIWCTNNCEKDFLFSSSEKLFWAQDLAMMTESFIRTSLRKNIKISHKIQPAPL